MRPLAVSLLELCAGEEAYKRRVLYISCFGAYIQSGVKSILFSCSVDGWLTHPAVRLGLHPANGHCLVWRRSPEHHMQCVLFRRLDSVNRDWSHEGLVLESSWPVRAMDACQTRSFPYTKRCFSRMREEFM